MRRILYRLAAWRARGRIITATEAHALDRRFQALSGAYGGRAARVSR